MPINFPSSPSNNQLFVAEGKAMRYVSSKGKWKQVSTLTSSQITDLEARTVGVSLDGSGDVLAVGAYGDDDDGSKSGSTFVYQRDGTTWSLSKQLSMSDADIDDENGWTVALNKDGDTLLTSSYAKNDGRGAAYIWTA